MLKPTEACLTIAGSDPSGGAGIQADLKTFTALNVYGCAVITCLTAQNSLGVLSYQAVDRDCIFEQIRLVLEDLPITHIKIGMIGSKDAALGIGNALQQFQGQIVYDPVLKASDGSTLTGHDALGHIREQVLSKATVITPNLPELEILTSSLCPTSDEAHVQALGLFEEFPQLEAVILTGGHFPEESAKTPNTITDYLILKPMKELPPLIEKVLHKKIYTKNTHGTGCTFSSAFTAYHLQLENHMKAFCKTVAFMDQLLEKSSSYNTGKGHGGLVHHLFREQL